MARLARLQKSMFLTPAQSRAHAQAQLDVINAGLAQQRQQFSDAILALTQARLKTAKNVFEVKLLISREVLETYQGEQAVMPIAVDVARHIIERHRQLKPQAKKPNPEPAKP